MRSGSTKSTSQTFLFRILPSPSLESELEDVLWAMNNPDDTSNESYYFEEGRAVQHEIPFRCRARARSSISCYCSSLLSGFSNRPFRQKFGGDPKKPEPRLSPRSDSPEGRARKRRDINDFHPPMG